MFKNAVQYNIHSNNLKFTAMSTKAKTPKTNIHNVQAGTRIYYNCKERPEFNREFEFAKVTDKRISWYTGHVHKSGWGKNTMRMAWMTFKDFNEGVESGTYTIVKL